MSPKPKPKPFSPSSSRSSSSTSAPGSTSSPPPPSHLPSSSTSKHHLKNQLGPLGGPGSKPHPNLTASFMELDAHHHKQPGANGDGNEFGGQDEDAASSNDLNVVAAYKAHFREDPIAFLSQLWDYGQGRSWRGYQNYIGSRILYAGHSEEQIKSVLQSEHVKTRIQALATARIETLLASHPPPTTPQESKKLQLYIARKRLELELQLTDVALAMIQKSVARLDSLPFLKFFAGTINNVLARMYHLGIHLNVHQVLEVRRVAAYAAERKQSIVFLPCHKSHIDYLTVSWLMFRLGIALPHIVAGENLDLPVLGSILRGGGAFFIRRTFSNDQLYPVVIREYIEQLLASGKNIECFIEGTRSRTGKLLPPKLGILKYILDGLIDGRTEDVWLCPISVQYDSVIESETYVSELLGKPKESESLLGLLSGSSNLLGLKMGRIDIRFQTPWSLKGFIKEQVERREAPGPNGEKVELDIRGKQHQSLLLKTLGYRILADINKASVIMPAALVGTVILTLRGRGVGRTELIKRVDQLKSNILKKGYQVADFGNMSTSEVVDRALSTMKDMILVESDVMETTFQPIKRFELSFYRNQVIHVFVSECLISTTLYTKVKQGGTAPMQVMSRASILKECSWLSSLLRNEFVYSTDPLEVNVDKTLKDLEEDKIVFVDQDGGVGISQEERDIGRENFDSYLFLLWPAIEAYWLSACSLLLLAPPPLSEAKETHDGVPWFAAKDFESRAQLFGKTLYAQGELSYLEAINAATLGQSFTRWEELGMIKRRKSNSAKPIPLMSLSPDWWPTTDSTSSTKDAIPTGKLWDFLEHLGTFRREGKDRRDQSEIVGVRIMEIVEKNFPPVVERERREDEAKL